MMSDPRAFYGITETETEAMRRLAHVPPAA